MPTKPLSQEFTELVNHDLAHLNTALQQVVGSSEWIDYRLKLFDAGKMLPPELKEVIAVYADTLAVLANLSSEISRVLEDKLREAALEATNQELKH